MPLDPTPGAQDPLEGYSGSRSPEGGHISDSTEQEPDQFQLLKEAAIEAEFETGHREETVAEAERHALIRVARIVAGFTLIVSGLAAIVLPGPGWLMVILGLSLLPYLWAQRVIRLIRRRIPGIPEDGRIPTKSLIVMGTILVGTVALTVAFGNDVTEWIRGLGNPDTLFG